ncbi:hypothetical protein RIR_jg22621.t1 [Rhizophagus irregularis DAOM 181602=DAOM 197198]|nr:hypothetical protein RIR_jg22621.t1 [Rhizophagus irregularis DAOM 181602=DAOM 197198]
MEEILEKFDRSTRTLIFIGCCFEIIFLQDIPGESEKRGPRIYKFPHLPFFLIGNLLIVHYSKNFTINITIELLNSEF